MIDRRVWLASLSCALLALSSCLGNSSTIHTTISALPSEPGIALTINTTYYSIGGSTAQELRDEMNRRGPGNSDAYTRWYVSWTYPRVTGENGCDSGLVEVSVSVDFTLPQWTPPANADHELVKRWEQYMTALQIHENGHQDIAVAAGRDVLQALSALPAYPSCDELDHSMNASGQAILKRYRQQELLYDQTTDHGAIQGARFP
jgi:predicted secreted Zn-dependent protease